MTVLSEILHNSFSGGTVLEIAEDHTTISTNPLTEGVFTGTDGIPRLRIFEEFAPYAHLLTGQEVIPGHVEGDVLPSTRVAGILLDPVARSSRRDVTCKTKFMHSDTTPAELIRIQRGEQFDGSVAYRCNLDKTPGIWNGKPYQERELGPYRFYHYAMVPHGAATVADGAGFNLNSAPPEPIPMKFDDIQPDPDISAMIKQGAWDLPKIKRKISDILTKHGADTYALKDAALALLIQIGMGIENLPMIVSTSDGLTFQNGDGKLTPEDESKLMQSVADLAKTVTALTAKVDGLASVDDLKKLQADVEEDKKLKQAAAEDADFEAFRLDLNAANRSVEIAKPLYQAAKVAPNKWRADHADLLLKNSSTAEDLILKGQTVANDPSKSDVRMQARQAMIDARDKKLMEA